MNRRSSQGGADDQAVAAIACERITIDADIQFDEAGRNAAADDDVVKSGLIDQPPATTAGGLDENTGLKSELAIPNALEGLRQIRGRDGGEKTEAANVDAQNGSARAGDFAGDTEHGAIPAKYD